MPTIGATLPTLADIARGMDPDGRVARVIELLNQTNEVLDDATWMEGNLPTGHRTTVRTGLPTPTWRLLNNGVASTKGTTAQIDEACAILEDWSVVDKDVAEMNTDVAAYRLREAKGHIAGMSKEMAATLFYGNSSTAPSEFTGLAPRYASLSAANGQNIVDAGGTGSVNTSIWLIPWGEMSCSMIYPKASQAGLIHDDLGLQVVEAAGGTAGNCMLAYRDRFQWKCGVALFDWRYVVRIANVDIANLVSGAGAADLFDVMIKAINRCEDLNVGKPAFYVNRTVRQMLEIQTRNDVITGGGLTFDNASGKRVASFQGIPVRRSDALLQTETRVT